MNFKRTRRIRSRKILPELLMLLMRVLGCAVILFVGVIDARSSSFVTPVAITNVTLVPKPGELIENASILIENRRIRAAGASVSIPPEAERIDGSGLWAYAGFIDATSHIGINDAPPSDEEIDRLSDLEPDVREVPRTSMQKANRNGIWPHRVLDDLYKPEEAKLNSFRKAGFTAALVTPQTGILAGQGDVLQLGGEPLRSAIIQPRVTQFVSMSGRGGRSGRRGYPSSPMGIVALVRQTFLDADSHRQRQALFSRYPTQLELVPVDPVLDAVGSLLDREQKCLFLANEPDRIHHVLDLANELNQEIVILGGEEAWKTADKLADRKIPVIASLNWGNKPKITESKSKESESESESGAGLSLTRSWKRDWENDFFEPLGVRRARVQEWEERVQNIQRLMESDVLVAVTSRDLKSPDVIWKNARTAIENGLTPDQLLATLTTAPASILNLDAQLGTIAPGKLANLTLMTESLDKKESKVRYVFIGGKQFAFAVGGRASEKKDGQEKKGTGEGADKHEKESEPEDDPVDHHGWEFEVKGDRDRPIVTKGNLLLRNATVLTVTHGMLNDADVAVKNGKIRAIGQNLEAPDDSTVIDLSGYWVMPGIIDPHSHLAVRGVNEGSQSITCEVRQSDVINHSQLGIHRALAGGVTTIHTMHGSANSIGGQNAVLKLKFESSPSEMLVTSGPRIVKFALGENVIRNPTRFPNTRMGVESVMRHAFNAALEYRNEWRTYAELKAAGTVTELPRRDLRLEALNEILKGDIWVHSHCYRADEILRLLSVARDYGFRIGTLQHVLEGYRVLPEMKNHGVGGSTFSDWWSYKKEAFDAIPYNASMMLKAGIVASLNSDSRQVIRYLNLEAAKTIRFGGLTADEAIRLITINPAIQIGLSNMIGSVDVGKDGDFAVFNGHPLDTHSRNVMTVIEGEIFFADRALDIEAMKPGPANQFVPLPPPPLLKIPKATNGRYAIVGATVHPIASDPFKNGVVIVEDGVIRSVGEGIKVPENVTVVDAEGFHVYPGLINAASQLGMAEISGISQTVDSRDLARFQPDLKAVSAVNAHSEHIPVALCEGITTAHVVPTGGIISGRAGVIQMSGWSMPEMLREAETGLIVSLPSLPAMLGEDDREKRLDEHEKAIAEIERYFEKAQHYAAVQRLQGVHAAKDIRLEAMIAYVRGVKPVFFRGNSYKEILEAIQFAETFALKAIILGGGEAWKCAEQLAEKEIPVIVTEIMSVPNNEYDRWDSFYSNAAKLEKAGVTFCIATDGAQFARQLATQAGTAIAHGLSKQRGLSAITLDAANILGIGTRTGSIEVGKTADLIITNGDPTQASTRTIGCFVAGNPVELTSLHEKHFEIFSKRPAPDLAPTGTLRGPPPMRRR